MELIEGLKIPTWLTVIIVILNLILIRMPNVLDFFDKSNRHVRRYSQEKRHLELLKMRYEIETLKKKENLITLPSDDLADDLVERSSPAEVPISSPAETPSSTVGLRRRFKYYPYGALGALSPILLSLLDTDFAAILQNYNVGVLIGVFARIFIYLLAGGGMTILLGKRLNSRLTAFLVGLSAPSFILALFFASDPGIDISSFLAIFLSN